MSLQRPPGSTSPRAFGHYAQGKSRPTPPRASRRRTLAEVIAVGVGEPAMRGFTGPGVLGHISRQWPGYLRDMKGFALVEEMSPSALSFYAGICGWTLARAHARSGDRITIGEYLGKGDVFGRAMTDFSKRYAEQNERDYREFVRAIASGRLSAIEGL